MIFIEKFFLGFLDNLREEMFLLVRNVEEGVVSMIGGEKRFEGIILMFIVLWMELLSLLISCNLVLKCLFGVII